MKKHSVENLSKLREEIEDMNKRDREGKAEV